MKQQQQPSWLGSLSIAGLSSWGAYKTWPMLSSDIALVPAILSLVAVMACSKTLILTIRILKNHYQRRKAMAASTSKGSARWASFKDIKQAKLFKQTLGLFLGISEFGNAIFEDSESHCLVVSPAGGGKTVSFVVPNLLHLFGSAVFTDLKGTITCIIAKACKKYQKCRLIILNPAGLFSKILGKSDCYNPLILFIEAWDEGRYSDIIMDARGMTTQLIPKPNNISENEYFRRGSVKIMVFILVYLSTRNQPEKAHLCEALHLLRDREDFMDALYIATCSDILEGELADMAKHLLAKFKDKDSKQAESFIEGAEQAIEFASPSSHLAKILKTCTFRFRELKEKPTKVSIIADPSRMEALEPWVGLMIWCALTEIKRCNNTKRVTFMLDECTNFRVQGISETLTGLREYGVKVIFVLQELEEYARIYGREAKETMLSQTAVKLFMGVSSSTAEWLSKQLGNSTIKVTNFNLGKSNSDPLQSSISDQPRPLLTPDEVRRCDHGILLIGNQFPIKVFKLGYNEVMPWKKWAATNPLHGTKFKGKTKLKIRY